MDGIGFALLWYLFSLLATVALWPLLGRVFPSPVRWGLARLVALPVLGYVVLLPATFGTAPVNPTRLWVALAVGAVIAWTLHFTRKKGRPSVDRQDVLPFEAALLGAYLVFALLVPYYASAQGLGERMRDAGLWTAMLTQKIYPFEDPWFAGNEIVYYVFGYSTQAVAPIALGEMNPLRAYDVALVQCAAWFFAACFVAFQAFRAKPWIAALGASAITFGGNAYSAYFAGISLFGAQSFNWWNPSRTIENTITEFPIWTATLGDLHPHYLGMWIFPTLVALLGASEDDERPLWTLALSAGGLTVLQNGTNTWELPVFACLVACVFLFRGWGKWKEAGIALAVYLFSVVVFAFPFARHASKAPRSFGFVMERSDVWEWLGHWGLWIIPVAILCAWKVRKEVGRDLGIGLIVLGALAVGFRSATVLMVLILSMLLYAFVANAIEKERRWLWGLAGYGLAVVLGCEFVHLKDVYGDKLARLNTVFKFYVPAWTAIAVPAVLLVAEGLQRMPRRLAIGLASVWALLLAAYPTVGLWARTSGGRTRDSLDGLSALRREMPDDVRLIEWMQPEVFSGRLRGRLLEAPGNAYSTFMRFASATGMPALIAWDGYGYWSIHNLHEAASARMNAARDVYAGSLDCDGVRRRMSEFGITHLVVATKERAVYPAPRLAVLEGCFEQVRREGVAALYKL